MRNKLATAATLALSAFAIAAAPMVAEAKTHRVWKCSADVRSQANKGTVIGAVGGALLGSAVAGHGAKTEGAVLGATVGGLTGRQVAKKAAKKNCRWVYYKR